MLQIVICGVGHLTGSPRLCLIWWWESSSWLKTHGYAKSTATCQSTVDDYSTGDNCKSCPSLGPITDKLGSMIFLKYMIMQQPQIICWDDGGPVINLLTLQSVVRICLVVFKNNKLGLLWYINISSMEWKEKTDGGELGFNGLGNCGQW